MSHPSGPGPTHNGVPVPVSYPNPLVLIHWKMSLPYRIVFCPLLRRAEENLRDDPLPPPPPLLERSGRPHLWPPDARAS